VQINMTAIGPTSVNQAIKAVAIAREYLAKDNQDIVCHPMFTKIQMDVQRANQETATSSCILLEIFPKPREIVAQSAITN